MANPFEPDGGSNPFEDDDDICIPKLDEELDTIVSNPFAPTTPHHASPLSNASFEAQKIIENVNLTYRARSDEAIIGQIAPDFFVQSTEQLVTRILIDFTRDTNFNRLITKVAEYKAQSNAIERRLAQKIQSNEAAYKRHQAEIEQLHDELVDALEQINASRAKVAEMRQKTEQPLLILRKVHKRNRANQLVERLGDIKTLIELERTLQGLLTRSEYTEAIKLMESCKQISASFERYPCCAKISSRLSNTSKLAINNLDEVLQQQTVTFDADRFQSLVEAYTLLGRQPGMIIEKVLLMTQKNIESSLRKILGVEGDQDYDKLSVELICEAKVQSVDIMISILTLFSSITWQVLSSFCQIRDYYRHIDEHAIRDLAQAKFGAGLGDIWDHIQANCVLLLKSVDLTKSTYDQLLMILVIGRRLTELGYEFCHSESESVQDRLKTAAQAFFGSFHAAKVDDLKMFLLNEAWEPCPVRHDFDFSQLREFKFLNKRRRNQRATDSVDSSGSSKLLNADRDPFAAEDLTRILARDAGDDAFIESDDDDEVDPELMAEKVYEDVDEQREDRRRKNAGSLKVYTSLTTNTALTILRFCGQYLQMADALHPVAFDVIRALCSLYDVYVYAVWQFFTEKRNDPVKLAATVKRIEELDLAQRHGLDKIGTGFVDFTADNFWGLGNRIVAIESVLNISAQMERIRPLLEKLMPDNRKLFFQTFFANAVKAVPKELVPQIIVPFCKTAIAWKEVALLIGQAAFNLKEIVPDNSAYVVQIADRLVAFTAILDRIDRNITISPQIRAHIWAEIVNCINYTMVDGFATIVKCTAEGRALMSMDYQQIIHRVELITHSKVTPKQRHFAEDYIRAYYLSEQELEKWLKENRQYTKKQKSSLVTTSGTTLSKKTRQRLLNFIETNS